MQINNVLVIIAMIIFIVAIIIGSTAPNTWKWTGITWSILIVGIIVFAMTII